MNVDARQCEKIPLYEEVAGKINYLIEQGTLRPGDRVPSIRSLSKQLQVSINTVKEAYSLLEDRRMLEARPQSGYYVRACFSELPAEPVVDSPINPSEVSLSKIYRVVMRDLLDPSLLQLGIAIPNPGLLPIEKLNRMLAQEVRRFPFSRSPMNCRREIYACASRSPSDFCCRGVLSAQTRL